MCYIFTYVKTVICPGILKELFALLVLKCIILLEIHETCLPIDSELKFMEIHAFSDDFPIKA